MAALELLNVPASTLVLPDPLQAPQARLSQCLLLALLAHVLLVVVLGSAPPGSASPGEGAWGRLVIRLQGPAQSGVDSDQPLPDNGPKGMAPAKRFGGSVRSAEQAARHEPQPGAAALGAWRPTEAPTDAHTEATIGAPLPSPPPSPPPSPTAEMSVDTATLSAPSTVSAALPTPTVQAPVAFAPAAPPLTAVTAPTATLAAPPVAPRIELPSPIAPSVSAGKTSILQAVPRPTSTLQSQAAASAHPAPAEATVQKLALPAQPTAALYSVHAPTSQLAAPTTTQLTALPAPSELRRSELAPTAATLQPVEAPTARLQAATTPLPREALPPPTDLRELTPSSDVRSERLKAVTPPAGLSGSTGGGPDRGSQLGHDVATAPSAKDTPQALNLKLPMQGPRISSTGGSTGLLPEVPRPPEQGDMLKKEMEKAKRDDCRSAYSAGGLLAAIPIAIDTVRDKGCKW